MTQPRNNPFSKATKKRAKLRLALMGPSGSGKTFTALSIAGAFGRVAVIDTEHGSASKNASLFEFDVLELTNYHPQRYIDALNAAADAGYDVVIIDSLSHAWNGTGGVLEIVDKAAAKSDSKNTFAAWRDATPLQLKLVESILAAPLHVIVAMRSKTEYVLELDKRGKMTPRKVGTAPIQRDGIEYEFDVVGEMTAEHDLIITKTRVPLLNDEAIPTPGEGLGVTLLKWLSDGVEAPPAPPKAEPEPEPNTVRGAGITVVQRVETKHTPPNQYPVTALVVGQTSTARTFALKLKLGAFVQVSDMGVLEGLRIGEQAVVDLARGTYSVNWLVTADKFGDAWDVQNITVAEAV